MFATQQNVIQLFEKKLQALLKTDELASIQLPRSPTMERRIVTFTGKKCGQSRGKVHHTTTNPNGQKGTGLVQSQKMALRLRQRVELLRTRRNLRCYRRDHGSEPRTVAPIHTISANKRNERHEKKSTQTFLEERMLLFRRKVETLIKSLQERIQEKVGKLGSSYKKRRTRTRKAAY